LFCYFKSLYFKDRAGVLYMHRRGARCFCAAPPRCDQPIRLLARCSSRDKLKNEGKKETRMQPNRLFEELSGKISALLAQSPAKDVEKNLRALLANFFTRLDLVTREEFDVQARLLARSREQINALEARVAELEARVSKPNA
jgi:BMFP domain-containing protein YqiC